LLKQKIQSQLGMAILNTESYGTGSKLEPVQFLGFGLIIEQNYTVC